MNIFNVLSIDFHYKIGFEHTSSILKGDEQLVMMFVYTHTVDRSTAIDWVFEVKNIHALELQVTSANTNSSHAHRARNSSRGKTDLHILSVYDMKR